MCNSKTTPHKTSHPTIDYMWSYTYHVHRQLKGCRPGRGVARPGGDGPASGGSAARIADGVGSLAILIRPGVRRRRPPGGRRPWLRCCVAGQDGAIEIAGVVDAVRLRGERFDAPPAPVRWRGAACAPHGHAPGGAGAGWLHLPGNRTEPKRRGRKPRDNQQSRSSPRRRIRAVLRRPCRAELMRADTVDDRQRSAERAMIPELIHQSACLGGDSAHRARWNSTATKEPGLLCGG